MNKTAITTIFTIVAAFVVFYIGYFVGDCRTSYDKEYMRWQDKLLYLQHEALEKADTIMSNSNLFDTDGSDTMADYLEITNELDCVWEEEL